MNTFKKLEWKIVSYLNGRPETIETFVSDREEAYEKLVGLYLDREIENKGIIDLDYNEEDRSLTNSEGEIVYEYPSNKIGKEDNYLHLVKSNEFEIEANVPVEVIVEKEKRSDRYPIYIEKGDIIINPIEYDFRNRIDPRRNLSSYDLKGLLGNLETISFWGPTILSRLTKIEAEIFSDVLSDIASLLSEIDKKNPK
jgi:hypothetical protein